LLIPFTVQAIPVSGAPALLIPADRVTELRVGMEVGRFVEEKVTTTSLVMVSEAEAVVDLLLAPIVTEVGEGKIEGAVYSPIALIVPNVMLPPLMSFTVQEDTVDPEAVN
jgi:hypothetical protein